MPMHRKKINFAVVAALKNEEQRLTGTIWRRLRAMQQSFATAVAYRRGRLGRHRKRAKQEFHFPTGVRKICSDAGQVQN